jgi:hypothetical protein
MVVTTTIIMNAALIAVEIDADSKSRNNAQFKLG